MDDGLEDDYEKISSGATKMHAREYRRYTVNYKLRRAQAPATIISGLSLIPFTKTI